MREAYLNGLALEANGQGNPYKFGLVGASDTHVAAGSFDENNYWSKVGLLDGHPPSGSIPVDDPSQATAPGGNAYTDVPEGYAPSHYHFWRSGLAGVWAEDNTHAIFDAFVARKHRDQRTTYEDPRVRGPVRRRAP